MTTLYYESGNELYHHGIKGQKWGIRRFRKTDGSLTPAGKKRYSSTSIRSAMARRSNEKIDKGFKDWNENVKKRDNAIALGKKANEAKIAYENDKTDKSLKADYKAANKEYKKALRENTTYRKGVVRQEVGQDASRKYLSEAKKIKKELDKDPSNRELQKRYDDLMSKHDIERATARRAVAVSTKRSRKIAAVKRSMTMTVKAAAGTAAVAAGAYAVNRYLESRDVRLDGKRVTLSTKTVEDVMKAAKTVEKLLGYLY